MDNYLEIRDSLQTGDIVLFSGRGLLSWLIRFFTLGNLSHIGLIIKINVTGQLLLLESDVNKRKHGVQLNPLGERIAKYKGKVWIRRLTCKRTLWMITQLYEWIRLNRNTSYEKGLSGLIELLGASAIFGWLWKNRPNPRRLFCSELITTVYKLWRLLLANLSPNETTPQDYWPKGRIDKLLRFAPDPACLSSLKRIK